MSGARHDDSARVVLQSAVRVSTCTLAYAAGDALVMLMQCCLLKTSHVRVCVRLNKMPNDQFKWEDATNEHNIHTHTCTRGTHTSQRTTSTI